MPEFDIADEGTENFQKIRQFSVKNALINIVTKRTGLQLREKVVFQINFIQKIFLFNPTKESIQHQRVHILDFA